MHNSYKDITSRISEPPWWWDECAVPRYCVFTPDEAANIYADQVVLLEIHCQQCDYKYLVCMSFDSMQQYRIKLENPMTVEQVKQLHYGDPPNYSCCAGSTMNSVPVKVVEFWAKGGKRYVKDGIVTNPTEYFKWRRHPELEIEIVPEWAKWKRTF
jgi:hypothetical protein